jgi:hypothetical protein
MARSIADQVLERLEGVGELYHRLLLVVAPSGSGKTAALQDVAGGDVAVVLLDNIEILFEVSFQQDSLRLLQGLARNRTVVAAWNGTLDNGHLLYATPGHPEYRHCPARDLVVVRPEVAV